MNLKDTCQLLVEDNRLHKNLVEKVRYFLSQGSEVQGKFLKELQEDLEESRLSSDKTQLVLRGQD